MSFKTNRRDWIVSVAASGLAACIQKPNGENEYSATPQPESFGGQPAIRLTRNAKPAGDAPLLLHADILPGRGFNTWQLQAYIPGKGVTDLFTAPPLPEAANLLNGGPSDYRGNESFKNGGAILIPFANRIRGKVDEQARTVETTVNGTKVWLPANWSGKEPGAERHAIHGLLLDQPVQITRQDGGAESAVLEGVWEKPFGKEWPGKAKVVFHTSLSATAFVLKVTVTNTGTEALPLGIGWHPYFQIPSGDRRQAKLKIPANTRAMVDNYDNVFPTGAVESTAGSAFDFREPRAMNGQFLDDCFFDLIRDADGSVTAEIQDPASHFAIRVRSQSPLIQTYQCYAPTEKPFIVLEPQFNAGDPFNKEVWKDRKTGMILLAPGKQADYDATVEIAKV
ncbi:MAG TPA: aldose 1-epimerase [Bryobacteraceae bacterium]|nr:aldose 1-epimerase [Bryobacteraceae bacterium]